MKRVVMIACLSVFGPVAGSATNVLAQRPVTEMARAGAANELHVPRVGAAKDGHETTGTISVNLRNVTLRTALEEIARRAGVSVLYSSDIVPVGKRVSYTARDVSAETAVRGVLQSSGLDATFDVSLSQNGEIILVRRPVPPPPPPQGAITGTVTTDSSHAPIPEVTVSIAALRLITKTGDDGHYTMRGLPVGTYTVSARRIGYQPSSRRVTVSADQTTTVDFTLRPTVGVLDSVVTTGTIVATERREIPNPITVITSDEIQQRGVTSVTQLLRGEVPSVIAPEGGQLETTPVYVRGGAAFNVGDNSLKTYIDGIEIADPNALRNIDPKMIERIEILRGPEATTIYGSAAIGGVMQIFTKKGVPGQRRPEVDVTLSGGTVESNAIDGAVAHQDHSIQVRGGSEHVSYNLGGSFSNTGQWQPGYSMRNLSGFGGANWQQGPVAADLTIRLNSRRVQFGNDPIAINKIAAGKYAYSPYGFVGDPNVYTTPQQTLGFTARYNPKSWWQNTFTVGRDNTGSVQVKDRPTYISIDDSLLLVHNVSTVRNTYAYNTTAQFPLGTQVRATLTAGFDHWDYTSDGYNVTETPVLTGSLGTGFVAINRTDDRNTGYFTQARLGFFNALFLTGGLRADDNPNFGKDYGLNYSPRFGVSYVKQLGTVEVKARAEYGQAFRPPTVGRKEYTATPSFVQLANFNLGPETQQGGDGGLELYFGGRGSLVATYYRQTVSGLISQVSFPAPPGDTRFTFDWENLGDVRNQGLELEGKLNVGRATGGVTYSKGTSRILRLDPAYRGSLKPGDRLQGIASATGGAYLSYNAGRTRARVDVSYVGSTHSFDYVYYNDAARDRLNPVYPARLTATVDYPSVMHVSLDVSRDISRHLNIFGRVDNITNDFKSDLRTDYPSQGRETTLGVRLRY